MSSLYVRVLGSGFFAIIGHDPGRGWFWFLSHKVREGNLVAGSHRTRLGARTAVAEALQRFHDLAQNLLEKAGGNRVLAIRQAEMLGQARPARRDHYRAAIALLRKARK